MPPGGVAEAARHCRQIAAAIAADGFGLALLTPAAERPVGLVFDCDFPLASPYLSAFLDVHGEAASRHVLDSSAPFWWCGQTPSASADLAALPWVSELPGHGGLVPGLAFPCYAERGPPGLMVFWGRRLQITPDELCGVHARAFALFEAVSLMRTETGPKKPRMSKRELECLDLTAQGKTSGEIAELLGVSIHTTNQHLGKAARQLNAVNRIHAVAKALRLGLIE